jgi:hypothetical protein
MSASLSVIKLASKIPSVEQDVTETNKREYLNVFSESDTASDDVFAQDTVELPSSSLSRVRRRSELSRIRKDDLTLENIELPVLTEMSSSASTTPFDKAYTLEEFRSVEYPLSESIVIRDSIDSASLSPAQKAYHRKRTWVYFCTCTWCFFMQGWNDGSTVRSICFGSILIFHRFLSGSTASQNSKSLSCTCSLSCSVLTTNIYRVLGGIYHRIPAFRFELRRKPATIHY